MNLLEETMTECVIMDKKTKPDNVGGVITEYVDGAKIMAAIAFNDSVEAMTAQAQGVKSIYTVITPKSVLFQYHDIFRRLEDGKVFRVTSDGDDKYTPKSSKLNIRKVTAEEFKID